MPKFLFNACIYIVLTASLGIFSLAAEAEIFVCKDQKNHITYQQEPCTTKTVRVLKREPAVPLIEQQKAQTRIDNANKSYEAYAAKTEVERLQSEKLALERENFELERQAIQSRSQGYAQPPVIINPNLYGNRVPFSNRPYGFPGNGFNGPRFGQPYSPYPPREIYNKNGIYYNEGFRYRMEGGGTSNTPRLNSLQP